MEITIQINGQALPVEVSIEVYEYLDQANHKDETLAEIMAVLNARTEQQRQRFFLYALEGMSYAEIGRYCGYSKGAVQSSFIWVRKKYQEFLQNRPYETPFSG